MHLVLPESKLVVKGKDWLWSVWQVVVAGGHVAELAALYSKHQKRKRILLWLKC